MKRITVNFAAYMLALVLLLFIFTRMLDREQFEVLLRLTPFDIAVTFFLALFGYAGNGFEYYLMRDKMGFRMEKKDILFLPLAMNLAGTLLPFQGAMAYQIFYLKNRYGVSIPRGCSIAAFLYLLTMTLSGIAGLALILAGKVSSLPFLLLSLLFVASAPLAMAALFLIRRIPVPGKLKLFADFVRSTLEGIELLLRDVRTVALLVAVYLLRLLSMILMFAWIARCLGMDVYFTALLLLNLWNMLSLILKFTPNNLGISQLVSGVMFLMIGLPKEQGILISLTATLTCVLVALTLGSAAMGWHFWQITFGARRNPPEDDAGDP